MGAIRKTIFVGLLGVVIITVYDMVFKSVAPPKLDTDKYWGPSSLANRVEKSVIKPFKIQYSSDIIDKLRDRLSEPFNLVEPLEDANFRYGFNKYKLEELIKYWRDDYLPRWNERQQFLNDLPQFTTRIQGFATIFFYKFLYISHI